MCGRVARQIATRQPWPFIACGPAKAARFDQGRPSLPWWCLSRCDKTSPRRAGGPPMVKECAAPRAGAMESGAARIRPLCGGAVYGFDADKSSGVASPHEQGLPSPSPQRPNLTHQHMIPFFPYQKAMTPEELQMERIARDARQLKEDLSRMTPEERARFWADIEGVSPEEDSQAGDGKGAPDA